MLISCVCGVSCYTTVTETISSARKGKFIIWCVDYFNVKHARLLHQELWQERSNLGKGKQLM